MKNTFIRYLREHPKLLLLGLVGITLAALLLTLIPAEYLSRNRIWSHDKIGHIVLFGSWTFLLGLYSKIKYPGKTKLWKIFTLGILFGGIIELLQHFLPVNRHGDIIDFFVDAFAALGAIILLKVLFSRFDR